MENTIKTISRKEIGKYINIFGSDVLLDLKGDKFSYFISKNIKILRSVVEEHESRLKELQDKLGVMSDGFVAIEKTLLEEYSNKGEDGNPIVDNGRYSITNDNMLLFEQRIVELQEHEDLEVNESAKRAYEYSKAMELFMAEKLTLSFYSISEGDLPKEITPRMMLNLDEFIK